jgi:hypothetical protein
LEELGCLVAGGRAALLSEPWSVGVFTLAGLAVDKAGVAVNARVNTQVALRDLK